MPARAEACREDNQRALPFCFPVADRSYHEISKLIDTHNSMTSRQQPPGILNRISREFGTSPVEFSPVDFDEYNDTRSPNSVDNEDSQFDVTLPWDLEDGSDHAEEELILQGPLHEDDDQDEQLSLPDENGHEYDAKQTTKQNEASHRHQQSLRLRTTKYFRGASPSSSVKNAEKSLVEKNRPISNAHHENSDIVLSTKQQIKRLISPSPTSTISTQASSISNPKNFTVSPRHLPETNRPLPFFPRTKVTSPSTVPARSSPTFSEKSNESKQTEVIAKNSTYSMYSDPPLGYPDDLQSQVSTSVTSVSYGSDLENAARRILGRKRMVLQGGGYGSDYPSESEEKEHSGSVCALEKQAQSTVKHRRPSRARMQRVTRRSIGMPARYGSDSEIESDAEEAKQQTNNGVGDDEAMKSLPASQNHSFGNHQQYLDHEEDEMAAILRANAEKNLLRSQHNNSDDDEDEECDYQNGAFPSFRPDPPEEIDNSGEVYDHENIIFNEYDEDWNAVPSASWVDPDKAFHDIGDDADENRFGVNYEEEYDADFDPKDEEDPGNDFSNDDRNQQQHRSTSQTNFKSVLEEDSREKVCQHDEQEFDRGDYIHDFGLKPDRSWGLNSQQTDWEDLPSLAQFSPSRRDNKAYDERPIIEPEEDDGYVTRTSEIDFFALDDENGRRANNVDDFEQLASSFDEPNSSTDALAPQKKHQQNMCPSPLPVSDGDSPTRKVRKGLSFFRSKYHPDGSWNYNSEGERSDSDWEASPAKNGFELSPTRSARWKNKQKMSPRGLNFFSERRHVKKKAEKEPDLSTRYEMLRKDSEFSKSLTEAASQEGSDRVICEQHPPTAAISSQKGSNKKMIRQVTPEQEQLKATMCSACSTDERERKNVISKSHDVVSCRSNTPVTNLNDSMMTQTTPLMSNRALLDEIPRPSSFNKSNPKAAVLPRLPPRLPETPVIKKSSAKKSKPPSPGFTGSDIIVANEEEDVCSLSTFLSDSLGSLVTQPTPPRARKTDVSVRSDTSEIERLRRENELLRERLETRSEASSRVSSAYVRTLKEQNELLRLQLHSSKSRVIRRNGSDMMYKSTIATLLDKEDPQHRRRRTRHKNTSNSPRKTRANTRKPNHPLIHGADFDDESITTYSESVKSKKVQVEGAPGILQAIATTTQRVAAQVKTAAQERNDPSRKTRSCASLSKPIEFMTVCARRDKADSRPATACVSTANSTKEVIGRALGCVKTGRVDEMTAQTNEGSVQTAQDSASDDLVQKNYESRHQEKVTRGPGVSVQL
jgi:hypothetical protein